MAKISRNQNNLTEDSENYLLTLLLLSVVTILGLTPFFWLRSVLKSNASSKTQESLPTSHGRKLPPIPLKPLLEKGCVKNPQNCQISSLSPSRKTPHILTSPNTIDSQMENSSVRTCYESIIERTSSTLTDFIHTIPCPTGLEK